MRPENPSHAGVCFDAAMTSFRNEVEPEYKAQRGEPPDDLEPQFDLCHEISVALGFATYEVDDYEADDLLGTIADEVVRRKGSARVLTTDKDLCQLVREDGRIVVHDLAKEKTFDADAVREKFGVSPTQIPDYLGLVGDKIDNLPGVPGIGAKSAAAVLQAFEAIEHVPDDFDAWGGVTVRGAARMAERIAAHRERALETKDLATVLRSVPGVKPGLTDLAPRGGSRASGGTLRASRLEPDLRSDSEVAVLTGRLLTWSNALTLSRLVATPFFFCALVGGANAVALVLFWGAVATDVADGRLARARGGTSISVDSSITRRTRASSRSVSTRSRRPTRRRSCSRCSSALRSSSTCSIRRACRVERSARALSGAGAASSTSYRSGSS